jgi:CheY-like chemotaxis protein
VLLTAYGSPEIEAEARRLGVDSFLHKPKPLTEVAEVVAGLLGRAASG